MTQVKIAQADQGSNLCTDRSSRLAIQGGRFEELLSGW
ncbi:unnamed protein product [Acidithrix sp. C25]|nr:unnamed protein product [Acidithrix sp. C25]